MIQKKISMIGSPAVGKTSLVRRFVEGVFSEEYLTTIGVKIDRKIVDLDGKEVKLLVWDIAGDDAFQRLNMSYLRGMSGFLLVADGTRKTTLDHAERLLERVESEVGELPFITILNKCDLHHEWDIQEDRQSALLSRGWDIVLTSALTGEAVEFAFTSLAEKMHAESNG